MKNRRDFLKTAGLATGIAIFPNLESITHTNLEEGIHILGPRNGYSPQVGTLLSMLTWMRNVVVLNVKSMKQQELDYLHDSKSNTIGAMLLHLAAVERDYQQKTFGWAGDKNELLDAALHLGEKSRKLIKGHNAEFYIDILTKIRSKTIEEFKKRDDNWLNTIDPKGYQNMPTNYYCKWFHVCEHESNHNGQIKYIKSRLPN